MIPDPPAGQGGGPVRMFSAVQQVSDTGVSDVAWYVFSSTDTSKGVTETKTEERKLPMTVYAFECIIPAVKDAGDKDKKASTEGAAP
jgi:hypothetical protein